MIKNTTLASRYLQNASSVYLDSLRILAALSVLIYHAYFHWLRTNVITIDFDRISHIAVIVFFVLSGYVIAYSTAKKNKSANSYFIARLSRLYSIVLPAIILTGIVQLLIKSIAPEHLLNYGRNLTISHYLLSTIFCNEIWFYSAAPQLNMTLWSLSFEFWYYMIFGLFYYRKKGTKYLLPVIIACIIAGPKILLVMPIWIFGYLAYVIPHKLAFKNHVNWMIITLSVCITFLLIYYVKPLSEVGVYPLGYASQFLTDWLAGVGIAVGLWFLPTTTSKNKTSNTALYVRKIADLTFPLYVLHLPLIVLWDTLFGINKNVTGSIWIPIIAVLIIAFLLGLLFNKYKYLFERFFSYLLKKSNSNLFLTEENDQLKSDSKLSSSNSGS